MGSCERHTAFIYDRGGQKLIGQLEKPTKVQWERLRDETSEAKVTVSQRSSPECDRMIGLTTTGRHELVIYRGDVRVWEGPITHIEYRGNRATFTARDVTHYLRRMIMRSEYDNSYPNIGSVIDRIERIILTESVRFESQVPPINIRNHVVAHKHPDNAGTSSHTLPGQLLVFEHMDQLAARGGLDYTAVGRAIHLWDVHQPAMGQTTMVTERDFLGDIIITEYGMELATVAAITDGEGRIGEAHIDPTDERAEYYGLIEFLDTAYDEESGDDWDEEGTGMTEPPSIAEMESQAARVLSSAYPAPVVVRVPDNSSLNPDGVILINELIPGIHIPMKAKLPGRTVTQTQKLDRAFVEETQEGETISVTLSPVPTSSYVIEGEEA